jgi:hypothetical protein
MRETGNMDEGPQSAPVRPDAAAHRATEIVAALSRLVEDVARRDVELHRQHLTTLDGLRREMQRIKAQLRRMSQSKR